MKNTCLMAILAVSVLVAGFSASSQAAFNNNTGKYFAPPKKPHLGQKGNRPAHQIVTGSGKNRKSSDFANLNH